MGKWKIEYYSGGWQEKADARLVQISETLNGQEEAVFAIPNTAENRDYFVLEWREIRISFDDIIVFRGKHRATEYSEKELKCTVYNAMFEQLRARVCTCSYEDTAADTVLWEVMYQAGFDPNQQIAECPTTPVTVNFEDTVCYDAVANIAKLCGCDFWTAYYVDTQQIHVGDRTHNETFDSSIAKASTRVIDASKKRDKVIYRGVNDAGTVISGSYGSGSNVAVFWYDGGPTVEGMLTALAQKKYNEINSEDASVTLTVPITAGRHLDPGSWIPVDRSDLELVGYYLVHKVVKKPTTVDVEIARLFQTTADVLEMLVKKQPILGGGGGYGDPLVMILQSLVGLYHLDEGTGTVAKDSSPRDLPVNGVINGATWQWAYGEFIYALTFDGNDNVNIGNSISLAGGNFAVGFWCKPTEAGGSLVAKSGQFDIQLQANGVIRFVYTNQNGTYNYDSDEGAVPLDEKTFVMYTFDGAYLNLYINGALAKQWQQYYNLVASTSDILIGSGYTGRIAEVMLWNRCLQQKEVAELYFFPPTRIVAPDRST